MAAMKKSDGETDRVTAEGPRFKVAIPARYASTRLPGKPLQKIAGLPMIQHVHARAVASGAEEVVIATDDERIVAAALSFGAQVRMTSKDHQSGTDRLAELARIMGWSGDAIVVNLQGDEPLMPPALIRQVAVDLAAHSTAGIATLCSRIESAAELFDPNIVKVVRDAHGFALYFSRAPIPWDRDGFARNIAELPAGSEHFRHIGLYAYRVHFLQQYQDLPSCTLERAEMLEQLRALWNGIRIHVTEAIDAPGVGVDTEADLLRAEKALQASMRGRSRSAL